MPVWNEYGQTLVNTLIISTKDVGLIVTHRMLHPITAPTAAPTQVHMLTRMSMTHILHGSVQDSAGCTVSVPYGSGVYRPYTLTCQLLRTNHIAIRSGHQC